MVDDRVTENANKDDKSQITAYQPPVSRVNSSKRENQSDRPSVSQQVKHIARQVGFVLAIAAGIVKFLAHYGPTLLQHAHDIVLAILLYINCNVRIVHTGPGIT